MKRWLRWGPLRWAIEAQKVPRLIRSGSLELRVHSGKRGDCPRTRPSLNWPGPCWLGLCRTPAASAGRPKVFFFTCFTDRIRQESYLLVSSAGVDRSPLVFFWLVVVLSIACSDIYKCTLGWAVFITRCQTLQLSRRGSGFPGYMNIGGAALAQGVKRVGWYNPRLLLGVSWCL